MLLTVCILWTWGLTPLWVNIVGSVLAGLNLLTHIYKTGRNK